MNKKQISLISIILILFTSLIFFISYNDDSTNIFSTSGEGIVYIDTYDDFISVSETENIVVMGTSTCQFCRAALPIMERAADDLNMSIYYAELDTMESSEQKQIVDAVSDQLGTDWGVPTALRYVDGIVQEELIGQRDYDDYYSFFSEVEFVSQDEIINFFGMEINTSDMPLLFSTFIIAFIDGFNPCSLWVLTLLLGIVVLTKDRKKILTIGLTYLTVAALAYGAFILGMINVFAYLGYLFWIRIIVALIAITFAIVNIKDFFYFKKGISFTISDKYKPKIFSKVRDIMNPKNNFRSTVLGSAVMALGITLVELPCTAGFPMIWSNIINAADVSGTTFVSLFSVYILTYFSVELVIFLTVVFTLKVSKFEEKHGRLLKLIGGVIMLALALVLVFNPDLLNNLTATIVLFGGAILTSLLVAHIYESEKYKEE